MAKKYHQYPQLVFSNSGFKTVSPSNSYSLKTSILSYIYFELPPFSAILVSMGALGFPEQLITDPGTPLDGIQV